MTTFKRSLLLGCASLAVSAGGVWAQTAPAPPASDARDETTELGEVVVTAPTQGAVSVYRGSAVTEMACAQSCSATARSAARPAAAAPTTP